MEFDARQLTKENKKFIYGIIREGARAKDFELAIRSSMLGYREQEWMVNVPLYALAQYLRRM